MYFACWFDVSYACAQDAMAKQRESASTGRDDDGFTVGRSPEL